MEQKCSKSLSKKRSQHQTSPFCRASGVRKTTAIIELIAQYTQQNKKVLLCGSTQASIDNVLLRIKENKRLSEYISPLRIGRKKESMTLGFMLMCFRNKLTD